MSHVQSLELVKEGVVAARAGEKERARGLFLDAVGLDPDNDSARLWLASVADSPLDALEHLDHILALNPEHEKALPAARAARVRAGVAAAKANDVALARTLLRHAVADDPECEKAWVWLAGVAETPAEAVAALEQALEINPDNARTRTALETYRDQGRKPEPDAVAEAALTGEVDEGRRRVLVVDDNAMVRKIIAYLLEQNDYAVRTAADGTEAISNLREQGIPDLILLDVTLPGQDGYQLCKLLRQERQTAHVPVVLLTEQSGFVNAMRCRMAGATEVFAKSLEELEGLMAVVDRLCADDAE